MRSRILGTLLLLTVVALAGGSNSPNSTFAAEFKCKSNTCPNDSKCTGDYFEANGCSYTCYKDAGTTTPGQIAFSGSANCAATSGNTGGSGGSGGGIAGLQGTYCEENWMWDSACQGPDDSYSPPGTD